MGVQVHGLAIREGETAFALLVLRFTRKADPTCADAVEVQGDPVRHMLPLNSAVDVKVKVPQGGELAFACPMDMYRGAIKVVATN